MKNKTFFEYWQDKDEIKSIMLPSLDPEGVAWITNTGAYTNCQFYLAQENGQTNYVYWVIAIREGVEVARWNTAYIVQIVWKTGK